MPIITIRPEFGAQTTLREAPSHGLEVQSFPMTSVHALDWQGPDPADVDALLIGSANAIRLGGAELAKFQQKPVFAVGSATAAAAREAGFDVAQLGQGGLQGLLSDMPKTDLSMLRVAARRHVELAVPSHVQMETRIAYEAQDIAMPDDLAALLRAGPSLVLLHSAGSALHFRSECERLGIDRRSISIAALGKRITAAAGNGWQAVRAAPSPRETALLALAKDLWQ